ncbi:MAG: hypothetical protein ABIK23_02345 [candidate division WOR-3 bacterium]
MSSSYRQEVFNVILAELLQERGVITLPEGAIYARETQTRRIPDVIVIFEGLRTAIEGEVSDQPNCEERALKSARERVAEGIAHIGIAVIYPAELRHYEFGGLKPAMARCALRISIVTESDEAVTRFVDGNIDDLASALRYTFNQLVREDVVAQAAAKIEAGINTFAGVMVLHQAELERLAQTLGIHEISLDDEERLQGPSQKSFSFARRSAIGKIAGLVLENALMFQEILAGRDHRVKPLRQIIAEDNFISAFIDHWEYIVREINYYPVLHIAQKVLENFSSEADVAKAVQSLADAAQDIVRMRAALRHDLMGRVYHRLLEKAAKYLGTYYTSISAATLLLKLALRPDGWDIDWSDTKEIAKFKIADIASGTGTLLMAAANAITDNYISALCRKTYLRPDISTLQKILIEDVIYGYDVLLSAVHLTASTLATRAPTIPFQKFNLNYLPLGGSDLRLGSIEFLTGSPIYGAQSAFSESEFATRPTGKGEESGAAYLPELHLCTMNPPFTRSTGGSLLFGSLPEIERIKMQGKLKTILKKLKTLANVTAGLGSVFVATAHPYVKPSGRLALVLPKALLSGIAWSETRDLLRSNYEIEYIIASHDPERWNFSENTSLSEILLIARKKESRQEFQTRPAVAINLWRNPTTVFEALAIVNAIMRENPPDIENGEGAYDITIGKEKVGEAVSFNWEELRLQKIWMMTCAFAQTNLIRVVRELKKGELCLPGGTKVAKIDLVPLNSLGELGPQRRDIHDAFNISRTETPYPAFWGHDSTKVVTIAQNPNVYLSPVAKAKQNRPLRKASDLWPRAGTILIAERMRLNTQRVVAIKTSENVLSNMWWPLRLKDTLQNAQVDKILAIWLNSTLGILCFLEHRIETEGALGNIQKAYSGNDAGS